MEDSGRQKEGRIWEGEAEGQGEGGKSLGPHLPDALRCLHLKRHQGVGGSDGLQSGYHRVRGILLAWRG